MLAAVLESMCWYWACSSSWGRLWARGGRGKGEGGKALTGSRGGDRGKLADLEDERPPPAPPPPPADCLVQAEPQAGVLRDFDGLEPGALLVSAKFWFLPPPRPPPIRHFLLVVWEE